MNNYKPSYLLCLLLIFTTQHAYALFPSTTGGAGAHCITVSGTTTMTNGMLINDSTTQDAIVMCGGTHKHGAGAIVDDQLFIYFKNDSNAGNVSCYVFRLNDEDGSWHQTVPLTASAPGYASFGWSSGSPLPGGKPGANGIVCTLPKKSAGTSGITGWEDRQ